MPKTSKSKTSSSTNVDLKRLMRGKGYNLLEEYLKKRLDAKQRLEHNFVAYVVAKNGGVFIAGGDVEASFFCHPNFFAGYTGYSSAEVTEVRSVLSSLASGIRNQFSDEDLHETIVLEFMSLYFKEIMEDVDTPQGLAVEMILVDFSGEVTLIYNTGDNQRIKPDQVNEKFFIVGCYDEKYKVRLLKEMRAMINPADEITNNKAAEVITVLNKKLKMPYIGFQLIGTVSYA